MGDTRERLACGAGCDSRRKEGGAGCRGGSGDAPDHGGNFRLVQRLCSQIMHILDINALQVVTAEVVEAAREKLGIGSLL